MILLRPGQLEVSQYKNGIMAVPAVPGAGKTTCLCHLATNLIEHELNSGERILIVTVMNSAVSNFKRKMRDLLDERELPVKGFEVKTLHSLGLSILKEKPDMLLVNNAFDLLTGEERDRILGGLTDRWLNQNRDRWQPFLTINPEYKFYAKGLERWNQAIKDMVSNMITAIKLRGLSRSEWDQTYNAIVDYKDDSFIKWVIEIINDYNAYLKTSGRVDFDDLIVLAYRLLQEDEALRERMQTRWKYIFEDEAQDSTPLQEKILQLLSEKSGNLVRVGDCNQGIMGFSGTDPSLFQRFCKTAINQPITMASRSTRDIMNFANNYVSWVRTAFPLTECREALEEQLIVGAPDGDPFPNPMISDYGITIHEIDGEVSGELEFIAKQAAQAVKQFPDKTVAILVRENRFNDIIAGHLTSLDVQFESVGEGSLSSQYSLEDVKAILAFLAEPYESRNLWEVIDRLLDQLDNDYREQLQSFVLAYMPEELVFPITGALELSSIPEELIASEYWGQFEALLSDIRRWLGYSSFRADELILHLAGELELDAEQRELVNSFAVQVSRVLLDLPGSDLLTVLTATQGFSKTMKFVLRNFRDRQGYSPRSGVITLSTMHRAKGLEWDTVYIPGIAVDQFPESFTNKSYGEVWSVDGKYRNPLAVAKAQLDFFAAGKKQSAIGAVEQAKYNEICESLRLIYVALTRARERLMITSHTKSFEKKIPQSSTFAEFKRFVEGQHGRSK